MSGGLLSKGLLGNEVRSELVRIRRRSVLLGWLGLTAVLGVLVNTVMFSVVADAEGAATSGPGVSFPSLAVLESPEGLTAGVASASSLLGMVTLALWALLTATDYSTGMVRLLVAAQPERWRLLAGKVVALALWTSVVALLALVVNVVAAPAGASAAGIDTDAWAQVRAADLLSAWASLYSALLAWGVLGLTLATLTRSAAVAISIGAGLRAAPRSILASVLDAVADVLPGSVLTALAQGGNDVLEQPRAVGLGLVYVLIALGAALVVVQRRDVTD
jgi:ABC-type transport system involved in multi-copper enzyme maturation permease subunit